MIAATRKNSDVFSSVLMKISKLRLENTRFFEDPVNVKDESTNIPGRRNLRMMVRAEAGDYFNRAELLEDLQSIRTLYRDHGYANVEAPPATDLDQDKQEVDVIVAIRRRNLVHFGRLYGLAPGQVQQVFPGVTGRDIGLV